jgi:hypothetical protein
VDERERLVVAIRRACVNTTQQTALVLGCRENVVWCGGGVVRGVVRGGCNKFLLWMMVRMVTGGVGVR